MKNDFIFRLYWYEDGVTYRINNSMKHPSSLLSPSSSFAENALAWLVWEIRPSLQFPLRQCLKPVCSVRECNEQKSTETYTSASIYISLENNRLYPTIKQPWAVLGTKHVDSRSTYTTCGHPFKWVDSAISATPVADRCIKSSRKPISIDKHWQ
jgi:hypothetical protein